MIDENNKGDGHDPDGNPWGQHNKDNVIPLKVPRTTRQRPDTPTQNAPKSSAENNKSEPLLNLPPATQIMLFSLLAIHIVVAILLPDDIKGWVYLNLGFVPDHFTGQGAFTPLDIITPFTHMLLHGSWLHIGMNAVMLLAFGSGIERWLGASRMALVFLISGLIGGVVHFALNLESVYPVIGASGGLSGLFAAALIMLQRQGMAQGKYGIWPFIGIYIAISIGLGMLGSPDGHQIAWAAHVGGFLGGFAALKVIRVI